MRYLLCSLIILFSTQAFAQANDADAAKHVAQDFLNAVKDMDYKQAEELGTYKTKKTLDIMALFATMVPDSIKEESKKMSFKITAVEVTNNKAQVKYIGTDAPDKIEELALVKTNGHWLVNMKMPEAPNSNSDAPDPAPDTELVKATISNFLNLTKEMQFEKCKKYCTEKSGAMLDLMIDYANNGPKTRSKLEDKFKKMVFEIVEVTLHLEDEENTYKSATANVYSYETGNKMDSSIEETFQLTKVNGTWLLSLYASQKNNSNNTE